MSAERWALVGLGNPGLRYAADRHNVGAMVIDELARRHGGTLRSHRSRVLSADLRLNDPVEHSIPFSVAIPQSYMNESGGPVKSFVNYLGVAAAKLIVIHDDLDLDFGRIRLKHGGGEGGHNGLRSISQALNTRDYFRIRVGIGRPPGRMDPAEFVLRPFSKAEREELPFVLDRAAEASEALVRHGLLQAQQLFHASGDGRD